MSCGARTWRAVQEARKNAGLALADRIALQLDGGDLSQVLAEWGDFIQFETLAETLTLGISSADVYAESVVLDGIVLMYIEEANLRPA
jgi:isoleucyl-tRNA synthetase